MAASISRSMTFVFFFSGIVLVIGCLLQLLAKTTSVRTRTPTQVAGLEMDGGRLFGRELETNALPVRSDCASDF